MSSRTKRNRTSSQPQSTQDKREQDKLICYRYAQCHNATTVGKEFGVSRMYVTRAWARMTEDERAALADTTEQVDEQLNQKILDAERIASDNFVQKVVQARELLADELLKRVQGVSIRTISNKDFTSLLRLVANISAPEKTDDGDQPDTLRRLRESIRDDIETITDTES